MKNLQSFLEEMTIPRDLLHPSTARYSQRLTGHLGTKAAFCTGERGRSSTWEKRIVSLEEESWLDSESRRKPTRSYRPR